MLTLYGFRSAFGLPDLSPFVTKAETFLRLSGIAYVKKAGDKRKAPRGKFPYIDDDGVVVTDSELILAHCRAKYGDALDASMTPRDQATATAYRAMLEEHLYFITLYLRWIDPRGWAVMRPEVEALAADIGVPKPLRGAVAGVIRRDVTKKSRAQGTGLHDVPFVERAGVAVVDAMAEQLGDQPWFLGSAPRSFDATAYAFLIGQTRFPVDNAVGARTRGHANLSAYCDRVTAAYFAG